MLTEEKILAAVEILPSTNAINVRWDNVVKRDDEVISRIPHRKAYGAEQKDEFLAEVEGAQKFVDAIGW
jgi:hypothetical protein